MIVTNEVRRIREHLPYGIRDAFGHILDRSQRLSVKLLEILKKRDDLFSALPMRHSKGSCEWKARKISLAFWETAMQEKPGS